MPLSLISAVIWGALFFAAPNITRFMVWSARLNGFEIRDPEIRATIEIGVRLITGLGAMISLAVLGSMLGELLR